VYLVGGACELPCWPGAAGAIRPTGAALAVPTGGHRHRLAIAADQGSGYVLQERFSRHFGVWREGEAGAAIVFDPIFSKDTRSRDPASLPSPPVASTGRSTT